jgi:hypothetical protein
VLKKKKLDLVVHAQDTARILAYADRLKGHELCADIDVESIEQPGDQVKAVLRVILR